MGGIDDAGAPAGSPGAPAAADLSRQWRPPVAPSAAPRAAIAMIEIDRPQLLRALDQRHDDLVRQLDDLNERIEQALAKSGAAPLREQAPTAPSSRGAPAATR